MQLETNVPDHFILQFMLQWQVLYKKVPLYKVMAAMSPEDDAVQVKGILYDAGCWHSNS